MQPNADGEVDGAVSQELLACKRNGMCSTLTLDDDGEANYTEEQSHVQMRNWCSLQDRSGIVVHDASEAADEVVSIELQ